MGNKLVCLFRWEIGVCRVVNVIGPPATQHETSQVRPCAKLSSLRHQQTFVTSLWENKCYECLENHWVRDLYYFPGSLQWMQHFLKLWRLLKAYSGFLKPMVPAAMQCANLFARKETVSTAWQLRVKTKSAGQHLQWICHSREVWNGTSCDIVIFVVQKVSGPLPKTSCYPNKSIEKIPLRISVQSHSIQIKVHIVCSDHGLCMQM